MCRREHRRHARAARRRGARRRASVSRHWRPLRAICDDAAAAVDRCRGSGAGRAASGRSRRCGSPPSTTGEEAAFIGLEADAMLGAGDPHDRAASGAGTGPLSWPADRAGARDRSRGRPAPRSTARSAISSSSAGAPWKPSGYSSAMKPVVSSPARKRGCCISADRKSTLWPMPSIWKASSASIWRSIASSRVAPEVISLAIIGS